MLLRRADASWLIEADVSFWELHMNIVASAPPLTIVVSSGEKATQLTSSV